MVLTHVVSLQSCSKATKVFQSISEAFCSSTLSGVARRIGNEGIVRDPPELVEVLLLPLEDRALVCPFLGGDAE